MPALSARKIEIVRTLVASAPDDIVGSLQKALADSGYDPAMADVRQLVEVEARNRRLRNLVLQPVAALCSGVQPGEMALKYPHRVLVLIWRGLSIAAASHVEEAAAALLDYARDEASPEIFDQLCAIAAYGLRDGGQPGFKEAAELCDETRSGGAAQLAACLDLAPVVRRAALRLHEWTTYNTEDSRASARLAFKDAVSVSEDAGPCFFEMLAAQLDQPWTVLRIIAAVMDKPTERYLAESELAGFAERSIAQIDLTLAAIAGFNVAGGPTAGQTAADGVELITRLTGEVEGCVEVSRGHGWGQLLTAQKVALADLVEARFKEAEKQFGLTLPMHAAKIARVRRTVPRLTAMPDPVAANRALTLLTFVQGVRASASLAGFAASRTKLLERLGDALDKYVEEVLDQLRSGDSDPEIARAYLGLAADIAMLVRDAKAAELVRRRTIAACQDEPPMAEAG